MNLHRILVDRWRTAWREVLAATIAALLAWVVAQKVFGHPHPIFAAVIAIVALGPGITSHPKQAWVSFSGVALGILVGELAFFIPSAIAAMAIGIFASMMIASSFGMAGCTDLGRSVAPSGAYVGSETAGYVRMIDVVIGVIIGLICGRLLLPSKK